MAFMYMYRLICIHLAVCLPLSLCVKNKQSCDVGQNKRARIADLMHNKYVSGNALLEILDQVTRDGLPTAYSRGTQYRSRKIDASYETQYGPLVHTKKLPVVDLTVAMQNPFTMIYHACEVSTFFRELMRNTFAKHATTVLSPLELILYCDEIAPQDSNSRNGERQACVVLVMS